jgi:hypothetical protein
MSCDESFGKESGGIITFCFVMLGSLSGEMKELSKVVLSRVCTQNRCPKYGHKSHIRDIA